MEFEELISKIELAPDNLLKRYTEALKNDTVFNVMKSKNRIVKPDDFIKLSKEEQAKYVEELFNAGYKQPMGKKQAHLKQIPWEELPDTTNTAEKSGVINNLQ